MRWLLLLKPAISVSTAAVFRRLPAGDYTDGSHTRAVCAAFEVRSMPRPEDLHNGLERNVLETYPEVARAREDLLDAGAPLVRLSGSGPTLFAPFSNLVDARRVQGHLEAQGYAVYLSRAIHPDTGNVWIC
jgi:4-diphosphocytidyl-2-C-methyl-D-erythritol kinase